MQSKESRWSVGMLVGGKYALLRRLGQGGFASVYEAENTWTGRRVAIKVLHAFDNRFHDAAGRFMREARVTAQLAHPNVVDVLDMGEEPSDRSLYIVQELLHGRTLRDVLKTRRRLPPAAALAIVLPVVEALVAAHDRGVVHRDIKPENIFLDEREHGRAVPKLIDFGVSKVFDDTMLRSGGTVETLAGTLVGTPEYMSPEQCLGDAEIDARADVWAVGVLVYELLAGRCPFEGTSVVHVLTRITSVDPPPLGSLVKNLPDALRDVVHRALERDRERRFPSMRAMRDALVAAAATLTAGPTGVPGPPASLTAGPTGVPGPPASLTESGPGNEAYGAPSGSVLPRTDVEDALRARRTSEPGSAAPQRAALDVIVVPERSSRGGEHVREDAGEDEEEETQVFVGAKASRPSGPEPAPSAASAGAGEADAEPARSEEPGATRAPVEPPAKGVAPSVDTSSPDVSVEGLEGPNADAALELMGASSPDVSVEPLDVFELGSLEPPASVAPSGFAPVLSDEIATSAAEGDRVAYCVRCADQSLAINALQHTVSWAEHGLGLPGATAEQRGRLLLAAAVANAWIGDPAEALQHARDAMAAFVAAGLDASAPRFWEAMGERAVAAGELGRVDELVALANDIIERAAQGQVEGPLVAATCRVATQLLRAGRGDLSRKLRAATRMAEKRIAKSDAAVRARVAEADASEGLHAGDPSAFLEHFRSAAQCFAEAGDVRNNCAQRANVGDAYRQLGDYPEAERALRAALALAQPMGLHIVATIQSNLGAVLARLGATDEAERIGAAGLAAFQSRGSRRGESFARSHLAGTLMRRGELAAAENMARLAVEAASDSPSLKPLAFATLASVLLSLGRPADALEPAEAAKQLIKLQGGAEEGETLARIVHIDALIATKAHQEQIRGQVFKASVRLVRRAQRISNERWRACFMTAVEENARTLALAGKWLDASMGSLVDDAVTEI